MSKPTVVILGSTGMLGSITLDSFVGSDKFSVIATHRGDEQQSLEKDYPDVNLRQLDAEKAGVDEIAEVLNGADWVVNAIGIIKPYIHDDNAQEVERAVRVNSLFPHLLAQAAAKTGAKVIQIATDCVYSGEKGNYVESDLHDASDVYGKTKSLGEAYFDNIYHVRCSIIGPELKGHLSLLDWFLGQDKGATLNGFTNHSWNGVTTLSFARIVQGIIESDLAIDHMLHVVPADVITKADLLKSFAKDFGRDDIVVNSVEASRIIDRTLSTQNPELNAKVWQAAGYDKAPTIVEMVAELAEYGFAKKATD